MSLSYRDARRDDAAALAELGRATFIQTFGHLYRQEDLDTFLLNHREEAWAEQLASPDYAIRLAENAEGPVAYVKLGPNVLPVESDRRSIELRQLYVLDRLQGSGIGKELMAWALVEAKRRQAEEIYLSVWSENHRARAFYERYGFRFVAPYAFMVGNQADEDEIFRLSLEPDR